MADAPRSPTHTADRALGTIVGILLSAALGVGGWAAQGMLALREEHVRHGARLEGLTNDVARVEGMVRAVPVRAELDALRSELGAFRVELREVREDLRRKR
jgi:hypothetical protein